MAGVFKGLFPVLAARKMAAQCDISIFQLLTKLSASDQGFSF